MPKADESTVNSILLPLLGSRMIHSHWKFCCGYPLGHPGVWKLPLAPVRVPPQILLFWFLLQVRLSAASVCPLLQEQVKEPAVLVQTWAQLWDLDVHSFISEGTIDTVIYYWQYY